MANSKQAPKQEQPKQEQPVDGVVLPSGNVRKDN